MNFQKKYLLSTIICEYKRSDLRRNFKFFYKDEFYGWKMGK